MRKLVETGFTLIELMIVVAILGILSAVAIPAYQDFIVRSKVTEGLVLAAALKPMVADNAGNATNPLLGGLFAGMPTNAPGTPAEVCSSGARCFLNGGAVTPLTKNVTSVAGWTADGHIDIAYSLRVAPEAENVLQLWPSANGLLRAGTPPGGSISWTCYAAGKQAVSSSGATPQATLAARHAPAECR